MDLKTHHKNIFATAHYCCQGGGAWWETKLSLWAEFRLFPWYDPSDELNFLLRHSNITSINNVKDMKTHHKNIPTPACFCWQGGVMGREAKLSPWAEFWLFPR